MATGRSFFEYVKNKCYNGLYEAADRYVRSNWRKLDLNSWRLDDITYVSLEDATIKRVYVQDLPGMRVGFDVGLELEIDLGGHRRRDYEHDEDYPWIRISCEGDISKGLDDWKINSIEPYNPQNAPMNSLSDALVPYIPNERLEIHANDFLKKYYPKALKITPHGQAPVYVDPKLLAERLGLSIQTHRIREDASVFGQLYFEETEAELYDSKAGELSKERIPEKTIVVDPMNFLLRNLGSLNNTIVHECVHWVKHKKVFELEKLFNPEASCISCEVVGGAAAAVNQKATDMMERQANQLAPRIQMPAEPFKAKANEYIGKYMKMMDAQYTCDVMEKVISELEVAFAVSKQAAKIRLVELGFDEAIGTFTYVDGHYVKPHGFKKGSVKVNQTFSLSAQDAAIERFLNPELRQMTEAGDYLFVDNHFVYNAPLYVRKDEYDRLELTDYARSHMDECCLLFDMKVTSKVADGYHTMCFLNREPGDVTFEIKYHNGYENAPQERQVAMRKKEQEEWIAKRKQMTDDPEQCMELLLEWRGMKYTELGDAIDLNEKTIRRTVKGETDPKIETAVRICFGLNLPPVLSEKLLEVLNCKLSPVNQKHQWIKEALCLKYPESFDEVCRWLREYDVEI